jgi:hypothetical protein
MHSFYRYGSERRARIIMLKLAEMPLAAAILRLIKRVEGGGAFGARLAGKQSKSGG